MKTLHVKNLPEMVFGHNYLQLSYKNGLTFRFNAFDALRRVDHDGDISQVSYAEEWTASKSATLDSGEIQMDTLKYDWSFTTDYQGTIITPDIMQPEERILTPPKSDFSSNDTGENSETENLPRIGEPLECNEKIDFHMLKTRDPILFFSEIHLYEDELSDNGISLMSVKIRVMPRCFLVLLRFWLRIDGVLFRLMDTRWFHVFGCDYLLRETQLKESSFKAVCKVLPDTSKLLDPNTVSEFISSKYSKMEKIRIC